MMPSVPNARYERKYALPGCPFAEAAALVRRHPAAFREAYPPRTVNNVYLDSPTLRDYHDHVNGVSNRIKTRVRWYGNPDETVPNPVLERKLKRGLLSGKVTHTLPPLNFNGHAVSQVLKSAFDRAHMPTSLHAVLQLLRPSLFNWYRRHYFVSADGRFRLTIDSELQFASPGIIPRTCPASVASPLVIELKFAPDYAEAAHFVTNHFPFRIARCSKYILGIEHTHLASR